MELRELLFGKLLGFRTWIISKATDGSEIEKKWAAHWPEGNIEPPSNDLLLGFEFDEEASFYDRIEKFNEVKKPSFFYHLALYQLILDNYYKQEYISALEYAFILQFQMGKDAGNSEAKQEAIQRNSDWKHRPKQDAALSYYKRFSLQELKSAQAAADEIDSKANTKLSYDTIYDYVRFYRKRKKVIDLESPKLEQKLLGLIGGNGELSMELREKLHEQIEKMRLEEIDNLRFVSAKVIKR
jgi:hypothetical protein